MIEITRFMMLCLAAEMLRGSLARVRTAEHTLPGLF